MIRLENILAAVREHKPCSRRQLLRYLQDLKIKPVGIRQRPQLYAEDTPQLVLAHLGLIDEPDGRLIVTMPPQHPLAPVMASLCPNPACPAKSGRIVSLRELKAISRKARGAK
jgi:hypothetical protein